MESFVFSAIGRFSPLPLKSMVYFWICVISVTKSATVWDLDERGGSWFKLFNFYPCDLSIHDRICKFPLNFSWPTGLLFLNMMCAFCMKSSCFKLIGIVLSCELLCNFVLILSDFSRKSDAVEHQLKDTAMRAVNQKGELQHNFKW